MLEGQLAKLLARNDAAGSHADSGLPNDRVGTRSSHAMSLFWPVRDYPTDQRIHS
jgi:hypothetical protein